MLVLTRRVGEGIVIADNVRVHIAAIQGKRVRLAFTAPDSVAILRTEIHRVRRDLGCDAPAPATLLEETVDTRRGIEHKRLEIAAR